MCSILHFISDALQIEEVYYLQIKTQMLQVKFRQVKLG